MNIKPAVVALQGLLILPAAIFMSALVARNLPSDQMAQNAQGIVTWYADRPWTLWMLLIALPLAVLVTGCFTLAARQTLAASRFVATMTLMAGGILAVVALHMLAN